MIIMIKKVWTGDSGSTRLFNEETTKDSLRIDADGDVDELNSFIGLARARLEDGEIDKILGDVQKDLFVIGSDLAKAGAKGNKKAILAKEQVMRIEETVYRIDGELDDLAKFILPSGTPAASLLHVARAICRRCERKVVRLKRDEIVNDEIPKYLNRLSSLLFSLARLINKREGVKEEEW